MDACRTRRVQSHARRSSAASSSLTIHHLAQALIAQTMSVTRLNRDTFAKLGDELPHPAASTKAEVEENLEYFECEMRRLAHSIAWISDKEPAYPVEVR